MIPATGGATEPDHLDEPPVDSAPLDADAVEPDDDPSAHASGPSESTDPDVAPPSAPASPPDPLAELPEATWYVRPPSGEQYGPARAELMRSWLEEGRVTADALVWREPWEEWIPAREVFGELAAAGEASETTIGPAPGLPERAGGDAPPDGPFPTISASSGETVRPVDASVPVVTELTRPAAVSRRRRRSTQLVGWLTVVVVLLGAVLAWVLLG